LPVLVVFLKAGVGETTGGTVNPRDAK